MAHLLNHSCDPNCYSRLTGVWDEAVGKALQHVVLYAKRAIPAEEELTYDYRWVHLLGLLNYASVRSCSSPSLRMRTGG